MNKREDYELHRWNSEIELNSKIYINNVSKMIKANRRFKGLKSLGDNKLKTLFKIQNKMVQI